MQESRIKRLKKIDREVLTHLKAQGFLNRSQHRKPSLHEPETPSRMLPDTSAADRLEKEKPIELELTRFSEFWPLADSDYRNHRCRLLGSILTRFYPNYDGKVDVDVKSKIGSGSTYTPKALKALAVKLFRLAKDAEYYEWAGTKGVSVRLY